MGRNKRKKPSLVCPICSRTRCFSLLSSVFFSFMWRIADQPEQRSCRLFFLTTHGYVRRSGATRASSSWSAAEAQLVAGDPKLSAATLPRRAGTGRVGPADDNALLQRRDGWLPSSHPVDVTETPRGPLLDDEQGAQRERQHEDHERWDGACQTRTGTLFKIYVVCSSKRGVL